MNFIIKISDLLYRRQKALEATAVFLIFCAVAFKFENGRSEWIWNSYPFVAVILALAAVFIAIVWVNIEKRKIQSAIDTIKSNSIEKSNEFNTRLGELSTKQREVFNLIIQGKSNKEITSHLVVELSTLKSHINQIYKKLGISNRREAQSIGKMMNKGE